MGEILTGDYFSFNAVKGDKARIGIKNGKSEQATRSGKNMINVLKPTTTVSGVDFTNNEDGSITINGTATANAYFNINNSDENNRNFFTLEKNQNYGLYLGNSAEGLSMICRSSTKNYELLTLPENQNEKVQQYTAETDNQCWAYLMVESGVTINNLTVYPMIVKGTEIGEWELYGELPRPNEESPIQNIEGNVNITIANSNLYGKGFSTPKTDTSFWHTVGVGFTPLEDGWGRLELDNSASSSTGYMNAWSRMSNFLNVIKPSTKYKIVVEWRNLEIESNINSNYLCICGNNNQEAFQAVVNLYYSTLTTTNKATFTVTTKDNIKPLPFLLRSFISVRSGEKLSIEFRVSIQSVNTNADYEDGKNQQYVFPLQEGQVLRERDYLADDGIHHKRNTVSFNGTENWKYDSTYNRWHIAALVLYNSVVGAGKAELQCNYFKYSNSTQDLNKISDASSSDWYFYIEDKYLDGKTFPEWLQEKNSEGNPLTVEYNIVENKLNEYVEAYTLEQQTIYNLMQNVALYEGINNIFCTNEITPTLEVETSKLVDDFDFYISSNGYLVFPQYDKKYLTNMSENVILNMPEAVQTTVKIAGKDGDLVLDSSYNSQNFQVVMFTDEGLTPEQKEKERIFINRIFNAMKKNSKTFAFEQSQKFYKVLYSGILEETNYPQHMMFTIPLKSSKPYAYKMSSSYLLGNDTKTSETIEPVGFICTINGPALNPIISFNDYSMEFDNTISEGSKLIIDTNNSTAVLVNSEGIETNAMRYYNHQFPKIMEGENVLKVLSGIDNPNNVFISWYDLTL